MPLYVVVDVRSSCRTSERVPAPSITGVDARITAAADQEVATAFRIPDDDSSDRSRAIAFSAALAGALAVVFATPISDLIVALLPGRATISSSGTAMGSFEIEGPTIVRRTGVVVLVAAIVALAAGRWRMPPGLLTRRRGLDGLGAVVVLTMTWYGWLAQPHHAFYTNARFHWVDYLTWDSDRFTYAAGRIPHLIFYDHPYVWQAITAGIVALLLYAIGRRLGSSRPPELEVGDFVVNVSG